MTRRTSSQICAVLIVLGGLAAPAVTAGAEDEPLTIRIDLSHREFPTLYLSLEVPAPWWIACEHETFRDPYANWQRKQPWAPAPADAVLQLCRSRGRMEAGILGRATVFVREVPCDSDPAAVLDAFLTAYAATLSEAGWDFARKPQGVSRVSWLRAGRKRVAFYRDEFLADDNQTISLGSGTTAYKEYLAWGFVVGERATVIVAMDYGHSSELVADLRLSTRDRQGDLERTVKMLATSDPVGSSTDRSAKISFTLPKGSRQLFGGGATSDADRVDDRLLSGRWITAEKEGGATIVLRGDRRASTDLAGQLEIWDGSRSDYEILDEREEAEVDDRPTLLAQARHRHEDGTLSMVELAAFVLNGVHYHLAVESAPLDADASEPDVENATKQVSKLLRKILKSFEAWETDEFVPGSKTR